MRRNKVAADYRLFILLLTTLLGTFNSIAQQEKNNIYLFDCTGSMKTAGLWTPAKQALDATIRSQSSIDGSQFTIIPFGDSPYQTITFSSGEYDEKKDEIASAFDKWIRAAQYTRISDVLKAGIDRCDPHKENRIYLLTDGNPNGGDTPEKVAAIISQWCAGHYNARLFYVALKENVVPGEVHSVIDMCKDAYVVQCKNNVIPQIGDISSEIHANIEELSTIHNLSFSLPGSYDMSVSCSDSLFTAEIDQGKASGGKIPVIIKPRDNASPESLHQRLSSLSSRHIPYTFTITISCNDERYFIANPEVTVSMADHIQSRLILGGGEDELNLGSASWHTAFLWSEASAPAEVSIDMTPEFFNVTDSNTWISFMVVPAEGSRQDFTVYFNSIEIIPGGTFIVSPHQPAILRIVFNSDAQEGKRYFILQSLDTSGIDIINNCPVDDFDTMSLRAAYDVEWNPLKTVLAWVIALLITALILWLTILKRLFYPTIKVKTIEFAGPDTFFLKKSINGAIKVVLTSGRHSQNILSRIFKGKIIYIRAPHFTPDIEIVPAGSKKRIRIRPVNRGSEAWDITPVTTFGQYENGKISHRSRHDTFKIQMS